MTATNKTDHRKYCWNAQTAVILLLTVLMGALFGCDGRHVTVTSSPSGATVWVDGDNIVGPTPVSIPAPREKPLLIRVAKPSYRDAGVSLEPGHLPGGNTLHIELQKENDLSIECFSTPSGADVFLDGEHQGKTPLHLTGLDPRIYEVSFCMKARQQVVRSVDLSEVQGSVKIECELGSLTEAYYLQQIETTPGVIHNYVDLAHHYVLEHRFADAIDLFGRAIDIVVDDPDVADSSRLWSEIQRVIDEQYEYGDAATVRTVREILVSSLEKSMSKHAGKDPLMLYISYMIALDTADRRQQAQEVFENAWKKFPGEKALARIRKQRRFAIP